MPRAVVIIIFCLITLAAVFLATRLHQNSVKDKKIKSDYFTVNQIKYGLLSGDKWTYQVNNIITKQIDSFQLNSNNKQVMMSEINKILRRLLDEVDAVLHKKQKNLKDKVKYKLINTFVDVDKFKEEVPRFSHAIIDELEKSKNKDNLKMILRHKVTGILDAATQDSTREQMSVMRRYGHENIVLFNKMVEEETTVLEYHQNNYGYALIGLLAATLLLWLYLFRLKKYYALSFLFSVLISFIALFIGVSLPMIEIDARISELDLELLASHIIFHDQVIFFQTKSILDVIHILLLNGKADSVFVGILIFTFSVLFPVTKLICTTIYLFIRDRSNVFVRYMAFNSGKWSMADVMVVAIFMAYVGFQGILDDQLADITVQRDSINLLTTNKTNLQTGFIIFVAFVLFNLILAEILKKIGRDEKVQRENAAMSGQ
jgi:hypothetical protein